MSIIYYAVKPAVAAGLDGSVFKIWIDPANLNGGGNPPAAFSVVATRTATVPAGATKLASFDADKDPPPPPVASPGQTLAAYQQTFAQRIVVPRGEISV